MLLSDKDCFSQRADPLEVVCKRFLEKFNCVSLKNRRISVKSKNCPVFCLIQCYFLYSLLTSQKCLYLFWNSILFHLLLDDGEQAYGREIFLGSKVKPHYYYYYYLLKPNCRNSTIPSAHVLQSPDKSHCAVPVSFVERSEPPKSTYILITVS